jgi:hypothetical protein
MSTMNLGPARNLGPSARGAFGGMLGCCLALTTWGCGRAAVDTDSLAKPASGSVSTPTLGAAATVGSSQLGSNAGVWSIAELKQHRNLDPNQAVSIEGVLVHSKLCYPCPEDIPCAPCGSFQLLGIELNSPRADAVGFEGSLMSERASEFEVGRRYAFTGTLKGWDDANHQPRSFVIFRYLSHRPLD